MLSGGPGADTYVFGDDWGMDAVADGLVDLVSYLIDYDIAEALEDAWRLDALVATVQEAIGFLDVVGVGEMMDSEAQPPSDPDTAEFLNMTGDLDVTIHADGVIYHNGDISVQDGDGNGFNYLAGIDAIVGGAGVNTFTFEAGAWFVGTIDGNGTGVLDYSAYTDPIEVDLRSADGSVSGHVEGLWAATGIYKVIGGAGNDIIQGGGGDETLIGGAGDDTIAGEAGNDMLIGGEGNDTLAGGEGIDSASYADAANGVTVDLTITAEGAPNAFVKDGAAVLSQDVLSGVENVIGSEFTDILTGNEGNNVLVGGSGADQLIGLAGADFLMGGAGDDTLDGGEGDDVLQGGAGNDTVDGGAGSDTASYATAVAAVTVDLSDTSGGINALEGDGIGDVLSGVENVIGSDFNDTLTGDGGINILAGGAGDDTLHGLGGTDYLQGEAGNDRLFGGRGADILNGGGDNDLLNGFTEGGKAEDDVDADTAEYEGAPGGVTVNLGGSADQDTVNAGLDTLINIENLTGSEFDDVLTGDAENNRILGGYGNDILQGAGGSDTLEGEEGIDAASYAGDPGGVSVDLDAGTAVDGFGSEDWLLGIENLIGSANDDTLRGNIEANYLYGLAGNDQLYGDAGDDVLEGGVGADALDGGEGNDYASFRHDTAGVSFVLSGTATDGFWSVDTLVGIENLEGTAFDDVLTGDDGDNVLMGLGGVDTLIGRRR